MTVADLKRLLCALPADCEQLPVMLHSSASEDECDTVLVNPPNNWYGASVRVLLTRTDSLPPGETAQILALPRHS